MTGRRVGPARPTDRRTALRVGVALAALVFGSAHTPYRQWVVYRRRVLLIGSSKGDPRGYELARLVAETLALHLPESRSRPSRAPTGGRLASLISTDQLDVAVLSRSDAAALAGGWPPFADFGGVPLAALFALGDHVLVSRVDFPDRHAFLVSRALDRHAATGAMAVADAVLPIPVHPGTRDYALGRPVPALDAKDAVVVEHGHPHPAAD